MTLREFGITDRGYYNENELWKRVGGQMSDNILQQRANALTNPQQYLQDRRDAIDTIKGELKTEATRVYQKYTHAGFSIDDAKTLTDQYSQSLYNQKMVLLELDYPTQNINQALNAKLIDIGGFTNKSQMIYGSSRRPAKSKRGRRR